jgi:hypothetical protein
VLGDLVELCFGDAQAQPAQRLAGSAERATGGRETEEQVTGGVLIAALVARRQRRAEFTLAAAWDLDLDRDTAHVHATPVAAVALVVFGAFQIRLSLSLEEVVEQGGEQGARAELPQCAGEDTVDILLQSGWAIGRLGLHRTSSLRQRPSLSGRGWVMRSAAAGSP